MPLSTPAARWARIVGHALTYYHLQPQHVVCISIQPSSEHCNLNWVVGLVVLICSCIEGLLTHASVIALVPKRSVPQSTHSFKLSGWSCLRIWVRIIYVNLCTGHISRRYMDEAITLLKKLYGYQHTNLPFSL